MLLHIYLPDVNSTVIAVTCSFNVNDVIIVLLLFSSM